MMRIYLMFLLFAIGATARAFLPPEAFKNLNLATDDDLNPLNGVPWAEGILENHAELMDYDHPLRELILLLFHRPGPGEFELSKRNPFAKEATPRDIGMLMGAMKIGQVTEKKSKGGIGEKLRFLKMEDKKYHPLAYRVLSTLLRHKANTRQDYKAYYEGLHTTYPKGVRLPDNWDTWLEEKFTPADAFRSAPPDLSMHYDAYLFWVLNKISAAPPLESGEDAISKLGKFPDCGETSLRNFIKLMLDEDGHYQLKVLEELGAVPTLIAFFKKFNTRESQQDEKKGASLENLARNEWSNLTVGHKEVRYIPSRHDMASGADNMLALLKSLLPGLKSITDWNSVFEAIEAARKKHGLGDFALENNMLTDEFGDLLFRVEGLGGFTWNIHILHFFIVPLPSGSLGKYLFTDKEKEKQVVKDVAVFHPGDGLPNNFEKFPWYLYTSLRSNENIEALIDTSFLPVSAVRGLVNRLSNQDTRMRIFSIIAEKYSLDIRSQLITDEHLRLGKEDLFSLITAGGQYTAAARFVAASSQVREKVGIYLPGNDEGITALILSPDGRTLYLGENKIIRIWDLTKPEEEPRILRGHSGPVSALILSPDGHTLYSGSGHLGRGGGRYDGPRADGTIRIWDLTKPDKEPHVLQGFSQGIALSPDGHTLYFSSWDTQIQVWDLTKPEKKALHVIQQGYPGHFGQITALAVSLDGNSLYSVEGDTTIHVWDLTKPEKELYTQGEIRGAPGAFAMSPDGHTFYLTTLDEIEIYDLTKPEKEPHRLNFHGGYVSALVVSPDGYTLYSGSEDKTIRVWDLTKPKQEPQVLQGHNTKANALALSSDGRFLYSESFDKTIRVWDLEKELKKPAAAAP